MTVGVLDFGVGNIGSILSMHRKLMLSAERVAKPVDLERYDRFILPGVGAFDDAMRRLRASGLIEPLRELVIEERRPLLGICLGMQLLADGSEEGDHNEPGLGWVPGYVRSMRSVVSANVRLPFMGWGFIDPLTEHPILPDAEEPQRFYFLHSYAFDCDRTEDLLATVDHGVPIPAVVGRAHIVGTQFHPEKSHRFGMRILDGYSKLKTPS